MTILPPTKNKTLMVLVIIGCTLLWWLLALITWEVFQELVHAYQGHIPKHDRIEFIAKILIIVLLGWYTLSFWRLTEWVRQFLTIVVIASSIFVPPGIIYPFNAMELGVNIPPVTVFVLKAYVPFLAALIYVYLLGRYRDEFRKQVW